MVKRDIEYTNTKESHVFHSRSLSAVSSNLLCEAPRCLELDGLGNVHASIGDRSNLELDNTPSEPSIVVRQAKHTLSKLLASL